MRWTFEVERVEFEMSDGRGPSEETEALERRASAEFNEAMRAARPWVVTAEDSPEAHRALLRAISDATGWDVRRADARIVLVEDER